MNITQYDAIFTKGDQWIGGRNFYPDDYPQEAVVDQIRFSLEAEGRIDSSWELSKLKANNVELTIDNAIIPRRED